MKKFENLGRMLSKAEQKKIMGGLEVPGGGGGCCAHSSSCGSGEVWCCGYDSYTAQNMATILALQCGEGHWCCDHCQNHSSSNCG